MQVAIENANEEHFRILMDNVCQHAFHLSIDKFGCLVMQVAIKHANDEYSRRFLKSLSPHMEQVCRSKYGNWVIEALATKASPADREAIISILLSQDKLYRHRYGHRIFSKLVELLPKDKIALLVSPIMKSPIDNCCHPYCNFVMSALIDHDKEQREKLMPCILHCVRPLLVDRSGCHIVQKAFENGNPIQQEKIVKALTTHEYVGAHTLEYIVHNKYGSRVLLKMQEVVDALGQDYGNVRDCFSPISHMLRSSLSEATVTMPTGSVPHNRVVADQMPDHFCVTAR